MTEVQLSTSFDNPMFETRWFAHLNDGLTIYEDNIENAEPRNSWQRLKIYCDKTGAKIAQLGVRFRSEIKTINPALGYFITYGAIGTMGSERTFNTYFIGQLQPNGSLFVEHWLVPELIVIGTDYRDLAKYSHLIIFSNEANIPVQIQ